MFERQIAAGMSFLDGYFHGHNWIWNIDVGELDLSSGCSCVLGQLYGDYDHGLFEMDLEDEEADDLGFAVDTRQLGVLSVSDHHRAWNILTEEWVAAIKDRIDQGVDL